mmetsp:Transcript_19592/g.29062  ORF Transcript_19592/g.29062 Transcript_19592/m.29062 type:complete len:469 (-) Transcript_19592:1135-2541(-)|eukprot:CAMPEP_0194223816 /NCGR_PEP_ID=MMETSP0156-20130528/36005_1 /TAXON_ID=33649 /ORGANISM="Thalassionema nitzschioides, Strain L26-B" /LENGTH=468 /DNA_ID=CAMNT_0038955097 /DNA_START=51 /DNA_END=1457 /DNA_ORIENTATION=+
MKAATLLLSALLTVVSFRPSYSLTPISSELSKKQQVLFRNEDPFNTRGGGKTPSSMGSSNEGATIPNEIFNLVKSIVGAGILGLPAGIAAFGNAPSALVPALGLVLFIGILSSYGFILIGRVCAYTDAKSYTDAWARTVGSKTSWIPALCSLLVCGGSNIAYSMILSETIRDLFQSFGIVVSRTKALSIMTTFVLLPLCLLKELKALAPFSLVGIFAMLYTMIAMVYRYFGGYYSIENDGNLLESLQSQFQPSFGDKGALAIFSPSTFILVSMLSTATMSHYLADRFYHELRNKTVLRFNIVVLVSFLISILIFAVVASFGFLTFGEACSGSILNNYSTKDTLMSLSRGAVVISLVTSYPLCFTGIRDGLMDLLGVKEEKRSNSLHNSLTTGLLLIVTVIAFLSRDLRLIFALSGATVGTALIYLLPTLMFMQCAKRMPELQKEIPYVTVTGILGVVMSIIGTVQAIK